MKFEKEASQLAVAWTVKDYSVPDRNGLKTLPKFRSKCTGVIQSSPWRRPVHSAWNVGKVIILFLAGTEESFTAAGFATSNALSGQKMTNHCVAEDWTWLHRPKTNDTNEVIILGPSWICLTVYNPHHSDGSVCCLRYPCSLLRTSMCKCSCPGELKSGLQLNFTVELYSWTYVSHQTGKVSLRAASHHMSLENFLWCCLQTVFETRCATCAFRKLTCFQPRGGEGVPERLLNYQPH